MRKSPADWEKRVEPAHSASAGLLSLTLSLASRDVISTRAHASERSALSLSAAQDTTPKLQIEIYCSRNLYATV